MALCLTGLAPSLAGASPCYTEVSVEPRETVPGEQLLYRVLIFRRSHVTDVEWVEAPRFPSFRAEWLPGRAPDPKISDVGGHYLVLEERRALFAARAGTLVIPAARVRCTLEERGVRRNLVVPVAAISVVSREPPAEGRPDAFAGLVGPVEILTTLGRRSIELGESVPFTITLRGRSNLWAAQREMERTLGSLGEKSVDVFPSEPRLSLDPGERLGVRLFWRVELVPRQPGLLRIPPLRLSYFDPRAGKYGWAAGEGMRVDVVPGGARASATGRRSPAAAATRGELSGRDAPAGSARVLWLAGLAVLGALPMLVWIVRRARLPKQVRAELAEAQRADSPRTRAIALERALRLGLAQRVHGADALSSEEIVRRCARDPGGERAAGLLARLEAARFGGAARLADLPSLEEVRRSVRRLCR